MGPRAEAVAIARKALYCYGNCVNRMDEGFPIFMFLEVHRNIIIARHSTHFPGRTRG